ncbi:DUF1761 domain-containing protein [Cryobacterium sp. SO1]|uniref:DUF1761 domain-containing protein n=1 Tax=Cryobacterium sp. SO1 TaxID=1897061 RepID=UPI0013EEE8BC
MATLAAFVAGAIWFGPKTFFPLRRKLVGEGPTEEPGATGNMAVVFGATFVAAFVQAIAVASVIHSRSSPCSGPSSCSERVPRRTVPRAHPCRPSVGYAGNGCSVQKSAGSRPGTRHCVTWGRDSRCRIRRVPAGPGDAARLESGSTSQTRSP